MIHTKFLKKLKDREGAITIELAIGVLVGCIVLVLILQTISILIYRYQMGTLADKVGEVIAVEGKYDKDVQDVVTEYLRSTNLKNPTLSLEGTEYIGSTKKIQLNNSIKVTIKASYKLGFDFALFDIGLTNVSKTRSEVYWK